MSKHKELLFRVYVTMFFFGLCALLLSFKVVQISIIEGERWRNMGDSLYLAHQPVAAERGDILSHDGRLLATSVPKFEIRMDLRADGLTEQIFRDGLDSLALCLSKFAGTGWSVRQYRDHLLKNRASGNRYLLIRRNVNYSELEQFKRFPIFRHGRFRGGFIVEHQTTRTRPYGMLALRTIGADRKDAPAIGLEAAFDDVLRGEDGSRLMRRLAGGTWIPVTDIGEIAARRGRDIRTTIDIDLQDIVHHALMDAVRDHRAEYGTAILMDVSTGAIRAMANIAYAQGAWQEDYNYAIGSATEPGSSMKLASVMALFEDELADFDTPVNLNKGYARFYSRELYDSEYHGIDESDLRTAFEISSNVGIAKLVNTAYNKDRQAEKFIDRLRQFGLHNTTGIEIPGEAKPLIKTAYNNDQRWSGTTLPWMSIGYECTLTPLQTVTFYNAVANDGRLMKPYLVDAILEDGRTLKQYKPEVLSDRIASEHTISMAQELLEGVVIRGTARRNQSPHITYAGKTGTARIDYYLSGQDRKKYQSSFVGYFPADEPEYTCIVLIRDPKAGKYYGSTVALPVFVQIAEQTMALSPVSRALAVGDDGVSPSVPAGQFLFEHDLRHIARVLGFSHNALEEHLRPAIWEAGTDEGLAMPDVRGMGVRDALYVLENSGLHVTIQGAGLVRSQSVTPGSAVSKGTQVALKLSS